MIRITEILHNDYLYVKRNPQVIMTVLLIVLIPVAFFVSGQQFLNAAKDNQERLEKERVGMLHDVFASFILVNKPDPTAIQNELTRIALLNEDITQFAVAKEEGVKIVIIAALNPSNVRHELTSDEEYAYRASNAVPNASMITPSIREGVRYWRSYRPLITNSGERYYLFTETSLVNIDYSLSQRIVSAYYWLIGILVGVLFLVFRHIRLIDYSYLYRETKKANEMKDMFINMIAHELRAPLTAMRGYASMIRERDDITPEVRGFGTRIEDSAERLVLIVNDLLDVARIHSGKLSVSPTKVNIQEIITSVLETMQASAQEKNIVLTQDTVQSEVMVTIDSKRFYQALTNLVSNSIKYTKAGSITLSLEERDDRIEIRVKDTGMGISAENQKNLFAPFFRVDAPDVDQTVGTGLGMWITKQLIELMKGSIAVESIKGVGTHVVVTLPK